MNDRTVTPQEIAEDAAEWFGRLETEEPPEATRTEFVRWLTRSPVHIEEFLRVSALHHALSRELKANPRWLADVLADAGVADGNVVWLGDARPSPRSTGRSTAWAPRLLWRAAAVVLAAVALGALVSVTGLPSLAGRGERFATEIGEQRRIVLSDGSGVLLNTATEIRVRMSRELRLVDLVRGEAIFDVEKDPSRPLRVVSGNAAVQAVGTRFVVYRQPQRTVVTVVEGRVLVSPAGRAGDPSRTHTDAVRTGAEARPGAVIPGPDRASGGQVGLDAGQKVTVTADGAVAEPTTADVESATAWTRGRLVFDAERLDTVVAELNRYSTRRLVIADAALGGRRITGVFKLDDPDAFLALLADLDAIHVERSGEGERVIRLDRARDREADAAESLPGPP